MWQRGLSAVKHWVLLGVIVAVSGHAQAQEKVVIGGTGSALASLEALGQAFSKANPGIAVSVLPSLGTEGAIKGVTEGGVDIGVTSRPLTSVERAKGITDVEYALTPWVVATGMGTRADGITLQQLTDVFWFKTLAWPDGSRIRLIMRPRGEINMEALKALSPEMNRAVSSAEARPGLVIAVTDQECAEALEKTPGALGPSTLGQIISEKRQIKALALGGATPSLQAIRDGSYPHVRHLFLLTGPKSNPASGRFIAFARSAEGRRILGAQGYWVK